MEGGVDSLKVAVFFQSIMLSCLRYIDLINITKIKTLSTCYVDNLGGLTKGAKNYLQTYVVKWMNILQL